MIPRQPRGEVRGVPLKAWVICVQEIKPPEGVEPVEWILLTNVPVHNAEDARARIFWYECRSNIEEYHKAMKTGASIEDLQFTKEERLQPVIALLSVIALFLLNLHNASRRPDAQERPASELLPVEFVTVLALWRYKKLRTDLTVHEFYYAFAPSVATRTASTITRRAGLFCSAGGPNSKRWLILRPPTNDRMWVNLRDKPPDRTVEQKRGPKRQTRRWAAAEASSACGTPIAELSRPPAVRGRGPGIGDYRLPPSALRLP